jgi:hypothetical protein
MLDDPECVGDLLALGLAMAHFVDFECDGDEPGKLGIMARRALPVPPYGRLRYNLEKVIKADIRRYDHTKDKEAGSHWYVSCGAPMKRRQGPCGINATDRRLLVDHDTGREQYIGACSRPDHKHWMQSTFDRNRKGEDRPAPPLPAANTGGVLARHLPEIGWADIYLHYDPHWSPPPEDSPWKPPTLSLHLGDDVGPPRPVARPKLAVLAGGGEGINIDGGNA